MSKRPPCDKQPDQHRPDPSQRADSDHLIKCYEVAEASAVQPFAYLQLVFGAFIGIGVFGEVLRTNVLIGAVLVVAAGVFTLLRARSIAR